MTNFQCQLQNDLLPRLARLTVEAEYEAIADDLLQIRRLNHGKLGQKSASGKQLAQILPKIPSTISLSSTSI
jgi:hypothetical protein